MSNNIYFKLKFLTVTMAILIVAALILLVVLIIVKKKNNRHLEISTLSSTFGKTINLLDIGIPGNCTPFQVTFKESYIAIYSPTCNVIKILNVR